MRNMPGVADGSVGRQCRSLAAAEIARIEIVRVEAVVESECKERRAAVRTEVQTIARPHLRVAEPVGRHSPLDGDQGSSIPIPIAESVRGKGIVDAVKPDAVAEDIRHELLPDGEREKFVQDDPLVMPAHLSLRHLENAFGGRTGQCGSGPQAVDHCIVEAEHRQMELTDYHVFIVPTIPEQGRIVRITRKIVPYCAFP